MAPMVSLARIRSLIRPQNFKSISTFTHLRQEVQQLEEPPLTPPQPLAEPPLPSPQQQAEQPLPPLTQKAEQPITLPQQLAEHPLPPPHQAEPPLPSPPHLEEPPHSSPPQQSPLPPNTYSTRSAPVFGTSMIPFRFGLVSSNTTAKLQFLANALDANGLQDQFAKWMLAQNWAEMKLLFEIWITKFDHSGRPNKPDVSLYNQYLRANFMIGASAGDLLDLLVKMNELDIFPNAASYNIVLKAMRQTGEVAAAEKLIERMLLTGIEHKESLPDDESYDIVLGMLFSRNRIDSALKYIDLTLNSGYMLSMNVFENCVKTCLTNRRLDTLVSIIERCKTMETNKFVCPPWPICNYIADIATQADNSGLTYFALEFMAKWIAKGEQTKPVPVLLSVDEGLVVSALGTAARTYNARLLDGSWAVLKRSLRQKKVPSPECYIAKINAYANMGNLQKAFITLHELENAHGNAEHEDGEGFFSPFYSLKPLVIACSKNGFTTLDSVYFQLENSSKADPPYKSVAALNCIILGCANIWDVDRAYQTFSAIDGTFGLTPNVHSYNALICAFGKLGKRDEAVKVCEHFVGLGVKQNLTTYSLLIDAHLIQRDPKAALSVVDDMIHAGYQPSRAMLKKIRRRCIREMDDESNGKIDPIARQFNFWIGTESRRNLLFDLQYSTDYA